MLCYCLDTAGLYTAYTSFSAARDRYRGKYILLPRALGFNSQFSISFNFFLEVKIFLSWIDVDHKQKYVNQSDINKLLLRSNADLVQSSSFLFVLHPNSLFIAVDTKSVPFILYYKARPSNVDRSCQREVDDVDLLFIVLAVCLVKLTPETLNELEINGR